MESKWKSLLRGRISKEEIRGLERLLYDGQIQLSSIADLLKDSTVHFNLFWLLSTIAHNRPDTLKGLEEVILDTILLHSDNVSVLRNGLSIFKHIAIPEELEGKLFSLSFNSVESKESSIACRSFGLSICVKIALKNPELKPEILELSKITLANYGNLFPGVRSSCHQAIGMLTRR